MSLVEPTVNDRDVERTDAIVLSVGRSVKATFCVPPGSTVTPLRLAPWYPGATTEIAYVSGIKPNSANRPRASVDER